MYALEFHSSGFYNKSLHPNTKKKKKLFLSDRIYI